MKKLINLTLWCLILFSTFYTHAQSPYFTKQANMNPIRLYPDTALRFPVLNTFRTFATNKDSIGQVVLRSDSVKPFIRTAASTIQAFALEPWVRSRFLNKPLLGKKALVIGDSFTADNLFQDSLIALLGITIVSDGVAGSTIVGGKTFAQGDGVARKGLVSRIDADLAANSDLDIVFIQGGSNDWNYGSTLGVITDTDTTTFYGAYKYIMQKCLAYSRPLLIIPITPLQRNGVPFVGGASGRNAYFAQMQYTEAIRNLCKQYATAVADGFSASGITYENLSLYSTDGVHPNTNAGRSKYSRFLASSATSPIVRGDNNYQNFFVNGNTGLGNTSPQYRLDAIGQAISLQNNAVCFYRVQWNGGAEARLQSNNSTAFVGTITAHDFIVQANNQLGLQISASNGNVGLKVSTPTSSVTTTGSFAYSVTTLTTGATLTDQYYVNINNSSNIVLNIPAASSCPGRVYKVKKISNNGNTITITPAGGTIETAATYIMSAYLGSRTIYSDGSNWWVE